MFVTAEQTLRIFIQKPSTPLLAEIPYWSGMDPSSPGPPLQGPEPWYIARAQLWAQQRLMVTKRTGSSTDISLEVSEHVFP